MASRQKMFSTGSVVAFESLLFASTSSTPARTAAARAHRDEGPQRQRSHDKQAYPRMHRPCAENTL